MNSESDAEVDAVLGSDDDPDFEDNAPLPSRQTFASERPSIFLDLEDSDDLANDSDRNVVRKLFQTPTAVSSKLRMDHIKN